MTVVKLLAWREAIEAAERELAAGHVKDARLNAELLAGYVIGVWTRGEVRRSYDKHPTEAEFEAYRQLVLRRLAHEPLQYITGETEFFGLRLYCSPGALIPRPDTEILVEEVINEAKRRGGKLRILDIGAGMGCITFAVASKLSDSEVVGIDVSQDAIEVANKNRERYPFTNVRFRKADLYSDEDVRSLGEFDIIVSNPPYIPLREYQELEPEVRDFEPRSALTDEGSGLSFYKRIFDLMPMLARSGGKIFVEIGQGAKEQVLALANDRFEVQAYRDLAGIERVLELQLRV